MAMAEVYYPDVISQPAVDDSTSASFPRAPPPSPEMQPRGLSRIFEIPTAKLDGIGLDLRRTSFSFEDEDDDEDMANNFATRRKPHSGLFQDSSDLYDDDDIACSPRKRVCCANNILLPENRTTMSSAPCGSNSLTSSGFGSYQDTASTSGVELNTSLLSGIDNSHDLGKPFPSNVSSDPYMPSKPHLIPPRADGGVAMMRDPFSPSYHNDDHLQNVMSRSFDLHSAHPHLPHSFETTQLPAVRPGRSRTLDTASLHKTLPPSCPEESSSSETNLDPTQRRRKVSVKRKNPEESENDPLQFSFDYSYSSTGSSGENDWVLVDRQPEGVWPSEKKPCSGDHSTILAHSRLPPFIFNGNSRTASLQPAPSLDVPTSIMMSTSSSIPSFTDHQSRSGWSAFSDKSRNSLQRHDVAMEAGFIIEDGEKMETDASTGSGLGVANLPLSKSSNAVSPSTLLRPHPPSFSHAVCSNDDPAEGNHGTFSAGGGSLLGIPSRHSCMEGFLHQQGSRTGWWGDESNEDQMHMDTEVDVRLNFSKSL